MHRYASCCAGKTQFSLQVAVALAALRAMYRVSSSVLGLVLRHPSGCWQAMLRVLGTAFSMT